MGVRSINDKFVQFHRSMWVRPSQGSAGLNHHTFPLMHVLLKRQAGSTL